MCAYKLKLIIWRIVLVKINDSDWQHFLKTFKKKFCQSLLKKLANVVQRKRLSNEIKYEFIGLIWASED